LKVYVPGRGGIHSLDDDSIQIDFARMKYLTLRGRIFGWGARCLDKIMKLKGVLAHPMCRGRGFGRLGRNVSAHKVQPRRDPRDKPALLVLSALPALRVHKAHKDPSAHRVRSANMAQPAQHLEP
jgi:hypothetical protein